MINVPRDESTEVVGLFSFSFNDTATTEIYTLSLHDALPISVSSPRARAPRMVAMASTSLAGIDCRSEEHTSELQSQFHLVCRLLLEKKKNAHGEHSPRCQQAVRRAAVR